MRTIVRKDKDVLKHTENAKSILTTQHSDEKAKKGRAAKRGNESQLNKS